MFDFLSGRTFSHLIRAGEAKLSKEKDVAKKRTPVTRSDYGTPPEGDPNDVRFLLGRHGHLSITDVYSYLAGIGNVMPSTVVELSFFSHSWPGGPILVNAYFQCLFHVSAHTLSDVWVTSSGRVVTLAHGPTSLPSLVSRGAKGDFKGCTHPEYPSLMGPSGGVPCQLWPCNCKKW